MILNLVDRLQCVQVLITSRKEEDIINMFFQLKAPEILGSIKDSPNVLSACFLFLIWVDNEYFFLFFCFFLILVHLSTLDLQC